MKNFIIVMIVLLLVGAFIIKSQSGLNFGLEDDRREFATQFGHWGKRIFTNTKDATAYIVKLDWIPDRPTPDEISQKPSQELDTSDNQTD